jgi:arylsulfatase A
MSSLKDTQQTDRRAFLKALGVGAAALAVPACLSTKTSPFLAGKPHQRPNFVFILVDDLGWADLGCYGNAFHETPHIDRLASQGMRFTDAYAAAPVCSPTRASIVAGQYPARIGLTDFITGHWRPYEKLRVPINKYQYLPLEAVTLAEALAPEGYVCGSFGKWHLGEREYFPDRQGFADMVVTGGWGHFGNTSVPDLKLTEDHYLTEVLADQAEQFMTAHRDEPFLLYLSHFAVHIPLEARQALVDKYAGKTKPDKGVHNPVYAAMIEHVDHSVGRVLDRIDALGLTENTVVVFFSDNGGLYKRYDGVGEAVTSNAPLRGEKGMLYEGGIREPLIVRWPGLVEAGKVSREPVSSVDFYPTFLDAARCRLPMGHVLDGESLVPILAGQHVPGDRAIYWHYPHYHHSTPAGAVRLGPWKLIEFYEDGRVELYNLENDISETTNLAERYPRRTARLKGMLTEWLEAVGAAMPVPNPDYDPTRAGEWGKHPDLL